MPAASAGWQATITLDRYGHLLPGNEHEAATLLDGWLQANAKHGS